MLSLVWRRRAHVTRRVFALKNPALRPLVARNFALMRRRTTMIDDVNLASPPTDYSPPLHIPEIVSDDHSTPQNVFVSKHYQLGPSEVAEYLQRKKLVVKPQSDKYIVQECPLCHPTHGKADNQWKLAVYTSTGSFNCFRCGSKGSFFDLKKALGDISANAVKMRTRTFEQTPQRINSSSSSSSSSSISTFPTTGQKRNKYAADPMPSFDAKVPVEAPKDFAEYHKELLAHPDVIELLTGTDASKKQRGLSLETLQKYHVGVTYHNFPTPQGDWVPEKCISFPWTRLPSDGSSEVLVDRVKLRSIHDKGNQRTLPAGGAWGFFGWHTIPAMADEIIITEGEYDAMAVYDATKRPAISLPNGARSLPPELLPCLERFKKVYLWMDNDKSGQEGAEMFSKKLGLNRCFIVKTDVFIPNTRTTSMKDKMKAIESAPKDANEALLRQDDLERYLSRAAVVPHEQIVSFAGDLRAEVFKEFSEIDTRKGVQSLTLPSLNKYLKGHRRGELTIVTGSTGIGKTTVLSQISLDYCQQGVTTLWGSFELKLSRLVKTMISQFAAKDFIEPENLKEFDYWADKFEDLPLHFMKFFGSTSVDQVLDALEYAVYVYDVQHIVLDNLQFMLSSAMLTSRGGFDKWDIQDRAIDQFRQFATRNNVHVTLVIHPKKEQNHDSLRMSSVFGTAKATQEADNVIIIQAKKTRNNDDKGNMDSDHLENSNQGHRQLEIRKNRYDGDCGVIPFIYDKPTCRIVEKPKVKYNKAPHNFQAKR